MPCPRVLPASVLTAAGLSLASSNAGAEPTGCGGAGRPWVAIEVQGAARELAAEMLSDLRAGLASTRIDVCEAGSAIAARPLASLEITAVAAGSLAFAIEVTDSVTLKRVARDVNLAQLPGDGRAFALAVAAEELLRATWAELALRGVKRPETAAPPEVRAVVEPREAEPARFDAFGARVAFEHYGGGQTHYGGDVFWFHPVGSWLGLEIGAGARNGLTVSAPDGSISGSALVLGLSLKPSLLRLTDFEIAALLGLHASRVSFDAEADSQATSRAASGYALYGRAGFAFVLGSQRSLRSQTQLGTGVPLSTFSATDGGRVATGVSELEVFATTGISLGF